MATNSVDLLTSIPQPKSTWEKIFDWTFSIGRYLVIGVEAVVLVAFVLRFGMDRVKNDLDKKIEQSVALLEFYDQAGKIENIQLKSNASIGADALLKNQPTYSDLIADTSALIANKGTIQSITIRDGELRVKGICDNLAVSGEIEGAFRTSTKLQNVRYDLTSSDIAGSGVQFSIIADIPTTQYRGNLVTAEESSTDQSTTETTTDGQ